MEIAMRVLSETSGKIAKVAVLQKAIDDKNWVFFKGLQLALDPMITFGVKKIPEAVSCGGGICWGEFTALTDQLQARTLTGKAAADRINELMNDSDQDEWNYFFRPILRKNLRAGVSEKTVNKVLKKNNLPEYMIETFSCQLAEDTKRGTRWMTGLKQIEIKLDGVRCLGVINQEGVTLYTRSGRKMENFPQIVNDLEQLEVDFDCVIDGEIISGDFQNLMSQVNRKSDLTANDAVLNAFDIIPLEDFQAGFSVTPQSERTEMLHDLVLKHKLKFIRTLNFITVDLDTDQGFKEMNTYFEIAIKNGLEGIMLKDPTSPYKTAKGRNWLKYKPAIEVTLEIVGVEEGDDKYVGTMGALVCEGFDMGVQIKARVGSGFSDPLRHDIWAKRKSVIGDLVEVKADTITKSASGEYSLRFPRFKCFRGFKPGEKM